ncbi:MAG: prepilin-type N-terminal cleavage/methylation domain-containing protein [Planctomycetes bacterium]|nr:prepilin-type N-terminal cleavage/methylation domain-containing protein [Planctomycetota bacterium]
MIRPQSARGFTLMEVLVAIGIFAIGLIAVASIFPVAILLQKQTVEEVEATHFGENAKAIVAARGFVASDWSSIANSGAGVVSKMEGMNPDDPMDDWSLADRSYNTLEPTDERRVFWVPLCYDSDASGDNAWQVFVFVVRGERDTTYGPVAADADIANSLDAEYVPRVKKLSTTISGANRFDFDNNPRLIRPGDEVVDEFGLTYRVSAADNTGVEVDGIIPGSGTINIWYAAPSSAGESSTFVKLITLIDSEGAEEGEGDGDIIRNP